MTGKDRCRIEIITADPFRKVKNIGKDYFQKQIYVIGDEKFKVELKYEHSYSRPKDKGGVMLHKWSDTDGWNFIHQIDETNGLEGIGYSDSIDASYFTPFIDQMKDMSKKFAEACYPL